MTAPEVTSKSLLSILGKFSKDLLSVAAALSLLGSLLYFVIEPAVEPYVSLPDDVSRIVQILETNNLDSHPAFIEILSGWTPSTPVKPGGQVDIAYWLKRNRPCETDVFIRFLNFETNRYSPETTLVPAIETNLTEEPKSFIISVKIPDNLPDGIWGYHPVLSCQGEVVVPLPVFFEVRSNND